MDRGEKKNKKERKENEVRCLSVLDPRGEFHQNLGIVDWTMLLVRMVGTRERGMLEDSGVV